MSKSRRSELPQMSLDEFSAITWKCGKFQVCDNFYSCEFCPAYSHEDTGNLKDTYNVVIKMFPRYLGFGNIKKA